MTRLVAVLAHPRTDSFCGGLFDEIIRAARASDVEVVVHDLYRDDFDPVLTALESSAVTEVDVTGAGGEIDALVARYQADVGRADRLVVVHPNWWGKPPAILAGWLDRVLAPGVAYKLDGGAAGTPSAQLSFSALIITTGDTDPGRESREFGDPLSAMWERCVLPYVGARHAARIHISPVSGMSDDERRRAIHHAVGVATQLLSQPSAMTSQTWAG